MVPLNRPTNVHQHVAILTAAVPECPDCSAVNGAYFPSKHPVQDDAHRLRNDEEQHPGAMWRQKR